MTHEPLLSIFRRPAPPWCLSLLSSASEAYDFSQAVARDGVTVRALAGSRMRTRDGALKEHAAVLQFPPYFGYNWDALDECLRDLSWLGPGPFALFVLDAHLVLESEDPGVLATAVGGWSVAAAAWGEAKTPFHVVLQTDPGFIDDLRSRWSRAGLDRELAAAAQLSLAEPLARDHP